MADLVFDQTSIIVIAQAMGIEQGFQQFDQVPNIGNLREQVEIFMNERRKYYQEQLGVPYPPDKEEPKATE